MKIGFCGTMSVGKTTMVNYIKSLPEFEDYNFRTERSKYLRDLGIPLNTDSTLKGQTIFLAERATELLVPNIITDRTVIDVMSFAYTSKSITHSQKQDFVEYASHLIYDYDHIFFISSKGVSMEDNGVRETDLEFRSLIESTIKFFIQKFEYRMKNFTVLEGTTKERIATFKEALKV